MTTANVASPNRTQAFPLLLPLSLRIPLRTLQQGPLLGTLGPLASTVTASMVSFGNMLLALAMALVTVTRLVGKRLLTCSLCLSSD